MRLAVDLQGWQTQSRPRGVGRYTLELTKAMLRQAGHHELLVVLNGNAPQDVMAIRQELAGLISPRNIRAWTTPEVVDWSRPHSTAKTKCAEMLREYALAQLGVDAVHVSSMFEGLFHNDAITSIGLMGDHPPTGTVLYDLTPVYLHETYLQDSGVREWYLNKLQHLRRAKRLLAISEATRRDGLELLALPPERIVNISAGVDSRFWARAHDNGRSLAFKRMLNLPDTFILYYGGFDLHKNVNGLIEAFGLLPAEWRQAHPLVLVGFVHESLRPALDVTIARAGLTDRDIRFLGRVSDDDLVQLLHACELVVYRSLREGFGLPVLEAMAAGAAVICSDTSSMPEVIGRADAMFDPSKPAAIAQRLKAVTDDADLLAQLRSYGRERARQFTWEASARKTWDVYAELHELEMAQGKSGARGAGVDLPHRPTLAWIADGSVSVATRDAIRALGDKYQIDLFVESAVTSQIIIAGAVTRDVAHYGNRLAQYDRIVLDCAGAAEWLLRYPAIVIQSALDLAAEGVDVLPTCLGVLALPDPQPVNDEWTVEAVRTLECAYGSAASPAKLTRAWARIVPESFDPDFDRALAAALVANRPASGHSRLLVDVTVSAQISYTGGISRVVNCLVRTLLAQTSSGIEFTPIRYLPDGRIVCARNFLRRLLGRHEVPEIIEDEIIPRIGDNFIGFDLNWGVGAFAPLLQSLRNLGGQAFALVYDLLPIQRPDWFGPGQAELHANWFEVISGFDGLICISQAVARDVENELLRIGNAGARPRVGWFHLGADFSAVESPAVQAQPSPRRNVLHVSQIWARKGHEQALAAFERLWAQGIEANYVMVGPIGYGMDAFIDRVRNHQEYGRRLQWYVDAPDTVLSGLYQTVDGVLIPSEAEGFGLPLIEAIHYGRPVLCRDLPVFREIIGDGATYFNGLDAEGLARALNVWFAEIDKGGAPLGDPARALTWDQSSQQFLDVLKNWLDE